MTSFEYFSVALSLVLGLGITQLLLGVLRVFRTQGRQKIHWIPLTWAAAIFIWQIQYWWALFELHTLMESWTQGGFVLLLASAILLFISGALVLPASESQQSNELLTYFRDDGKWALLALVAYSAISLWVNWLLYGRSPLNDVTALLIAFSALALTAFFFARTRSLGIITILFFVLTVYTFSVAAPTKY